MDSFCVSTQVFQNVANETSIGDPMMFSSPCMLEMKKYELGKAYLFVCEHAVDEEVILDCSFDPPFLPCNQVVEGDHSQDLVVHAHLVMFCSSWSGDIGVARHLSNNFFAVDSGRPTVLGVETGSC